MINQFFTSIFLLLIKIYRLAISPLLGPCCRFYPSCSQYGMEAIQKYGAWKGGWLTAKRIFSCGFWNNGGNDPVP